MNNFKYEFTTAAIALLDHSEIDVNKGNYEDTTPLMEASKYGYPKTVAPLLFHPNIIVTKATWEDGNTALIYASNNGHLEVISLHLRCPETDVSHQNDNFETAYEIAANKGFSNITEQFDNRGYLTSTAGHTCCSRQRKKGLQIAARDNDLEATTAFLRCHGIDLNEGYESGLTPLYIASRENHTKIVQQILKVSNIDVNKICNGENALITASERGFTYIVGLLLDIPTIDTNINKRGSEGSALFLASANNYSEIVKMLLLEPQIEVNGAYGPGRRTSLISTAIEGFFKASELLLRCPKTDITLTNVFGDTALDVSGNEIKEAITRRDELLKGSNTCCLNATKVLLEIAKLGDYKGVRGLAKCPNADINKQDVKGRTGLYLASWMGHFDTVREFLVLPNIDANMGTKLTGDTAYSIASKKSNFDVMMILSQHREVDFNKGWLYDAWTTVTEKQEFQSNEGAVAESRPLNGSMVVDTGRII